MLGLPSLSTFVRAIRLLSTLVLPTFVWVATPAAAAGLMTAVGSPSPLAIEDHQVHVIVEDGYATTTIEQTFRNSSGGDLEAVYAFPVPERAAVSEFTYWIDGKPVTAEVMKRDQARTLYENEKSKKHETALAEQEDFHRFQMSVWPVRANADVRIRLSYIQAVKLDAGVGRYVYPLEEGGTDDPGVSSFWSMKDEINGRYDFDMTLRTSYPIEALRLPAHPDATISQDEDGSWHISFSRGNTASEPGATTQPSVAQPSLNNDVVVYWRQSPGLPGSLDVLAYKAKPDGRGTFLAALTPGDDTTAITSGRDWTFIVDRSGSMQSKFATVTEGLGRTLKSLPAQDRFRVIAFNETANRLFDYRAASPEEIKRTIDELLGLAASGGTNLYAGLRLGLESLDQDRPNGVVLITDGVANVGLHERKDFLDLASAHDVRLFTVVMGNSADGPLLEHLAAISGGTSMTVSNSDDIAGRLMTAVKRLSHHALADIKVDIGGVKTADLTPELKGALFRGEQLVVFGHYWGSGPANVRVSGKIDGKDVVYQATLDMPGVAREYPEIERLWAFSRIEDAMRTTAAIGEAEDTTKAIVDTAVEFGLLTPYTSMVVVRDEVFTQMGVDRTNQQRLQTETDARGARGQSTPSFASAPIGSSPRASFTTNGGASRSNGSGGSNGSGAAGPFLLLLLAAFHLSRVRWRAKQGNHAA